MAQTEPGVVQETAISPSGMRQLSYMEIYYEDLANDPPTVLAKVHEWLEFPKEDLQAPTTVKLSNPTALLAKEAYLRSIGA